MECRGKIVNIEGNVYHVKVRQTSACALCGIRKVCPTFESKESNFRIMKKNSSETFSLGQDVMVYGSKSMGMKAVLVAFGIPLLLAFVWLPVAFLELEMEDFLSVGILLLVYMAYFLFLKFNHTKWDKAFSLELKQDLHSEN